VLSLNDGKVGKMIPDPDPDPLSDQSEIEQNVPHLKAGPSQTFYEHSSQLSE